MFWLLAAAYGPGAQVDERLGDSNGNHLVQLKDLIITKQTTFLLSFGEVELMGVKEVHRFLVDLAKLALVKHSTRPARKYLTVRPTSPSSDVYSLQGSRLGFGNRDHVYLVWSGPAVTLDAFRGKLPPFRPIGSQWYGTQWRAMTHTFFASEIAPITQQRFVLDDHFLKTIDCVFFRSLIMANVTYPHSTGSRCERLSSLSGRDSLCMWSFCSKSTFRKLVSQQ